MTLDAFTNRLASLYEILKVYPKDFSEQDFVQIPKISSFLDVGLVQPIQTFTPIFDGSPDVMRDLRIQFRSILLGIKTTLFNLKQAMVSHVNSTQTGTNSTSYRDEVEIYMGIFRNGILSFQYYLAQESLDLEKGIQKSPLSLSPSNLTAPIAKEDKDTLETFASIFTFVEPYIFQEICSQNIEFLFDQTLVTPPILAITQFIVANGAMSSNFCSLLLDFLVSKLEHLGGEDQHYSSVLFRYFKLFFMALTLFPEQNELVLRPHLANIIMDCLKIAELYQLLFAFKIPF